MGTELAPRKVVSALSCTALVTLALVPETGLWFIDRAVHHTQHELQPIIDQIVTQMMSTGQDAPKYSLQLPRFRHGPTAQTEDCRP